MKNISIVNAANFKINNVGTGQFNQTSNPVLKKPQIFPSMLFSNTLDRGVIVNIPAYPEMAAGDTISVGIGAVQLWAYTVTEDDVGKDISTSNGDPSTLQVALASQQDSITFAYTVQSHSQLYSENGLSELAVIPILPETPEELPALVSGTSDIFPADKVLFGDVFVPLPKYNNASVGDQVRFYWQVETGDNKFIFSMAVSVTSAFALPSGDRRLTGMSFMQELAVLSLGQTVSLWYQVTSSGGKNLGYSKVALIKVPSMAVLAAPEVLSSPYRNSDPDQNIVLRAPAYSGMRAGDIISATHVFSTDNTDDTDSFTSSNYLVTDEMIGQDMIITITGEAAGKRYKESVSYFVQRNGTYIHSSGSAAITSSI